jgi:hypothetical protein
MVYTGLFSSLNTDKSKSLPVNPKLALQQWDNYGVYNLACFDINTTRTVTRQLFDVIKNRDGVAGNFLGILPADWTRWESILFDVDINTDLFIPKENSPFVEQTNLTQFMRSWIAWQAFAPATIEVDFCKYIKAYCNSEDLIDKIKKYFKIETRFSAFPAQLKTKKYEFPDGYVYYENYHFQVKSKNDYYYAKYKTRYIVLRESTTYVDDAIIDWSYPPYPTPTYRPTNYPRSRLLYDGFDFNLSVSAKESPEPGYDWNSVPYNGDGQKIFSRSEVFINITTTHDYLKYYHVKIESKNSKHPKLPNYLDLVTGYLLDIRSIPQSIEIQSPITASIQIGYYRKNKYEQLYTNNILDESDDIERSAYLTSINWVRRTIEIERGKLITLDIEEIVLGTLWCNNPTISNLLSNARTKQDEYSSRYLLYSDSDIEQLFTTWNSLWLTEKNKPILPIIPSSYSLFSEINRIKLESTICRIIAANNNYWHNGTIQPDLNTVEDPQYHPMYTINDRIYDLHFKALGGLDGYGDIEMNSPELIEIHAALNADKYSKNPDNPSLPRVTTLGHYIEKALELIGYRPEPNGNFSEQKEKARVRQIIPAAQKVDPTKVGVNNFGEGGMILKRLNNRFKGDEIVADECVIVQDLLQLISEYHDQENLALGIQESSAIEINNQNGTAKFNNQLELLIELVNLVKDSNEMIRSILVSGLVTQGQTTELIAGLGLPSVTKTLPITIDGKNKQIPYKGIAAHRSISQEVATVAYNVGIVTGQLI